MYCTEKVRYIYARGKAEGRQIRTQRNQATLKQLVGSSQARYSMAFTSCKPSAMVVASNARPLVFHRTLQRGFTNGGSSSSTNQHHVDTLIIGGGPVGLSTAYHLATQYCNNDGSGITIVERDPTYSRSSATLSAGGIRQQVVSNNCILCVQYMSLFILTQIFSKTSFILLNITSVHIVPYSLA